MRDFAPRRTASKTRCPASDPASCVAGLWEPASASIGRGQSWLPCSGAVAFVAARPLCLSFRCSKYDYWLGRPMLIIGGNSATFGSRVRAGPRVVVPNTVLSSRDCRSARMVLGATTAPAAQLSAKLFRKFGRICDANWSHETLAPNVEAGAACGAVAAFASAAPARR